MALALVGCDLSSTLPDDATPTADLAGRVSPANLPTAAEAALVVGVTVDPGDFGQAWRVEVGLPEGATAYDALVASGAQVNASSSVYGMYVEAVDGLASLAHGPESGWLFEVNGQAASVGCSSLVLAAGDEVRWHYSTTWE